MHVFWQQHRALRETLFRKNILLTEKYELSLLEHTYLSNPSRLISIIKENKSEEYIHLDSIDFKTENKKNERK